MFTHAIGASTHLALLEPRHASELLALVDANREHLRPWMNWLDVTRTVSDTAGFIRRVREGWAQDTALACGIWHEGALVGVVDFHGMQRGIAEIGYWIGAAHEGKGLVTKACRALIDHGFTSLGLHRIEIRCATGNTRSRAVPERLGFILEGVLRDVWPIHGGHVDHAVYAMLAREWSQKPDGHTGPPEGGDGAAIG